MALFKKGPRLRAAVNVVDFEESRPFGIPSSPPHPGTGDRRQDITFPSDELQDDPSGADPWAGRRVIEGDEEKEAGERGLNLPDLTMRQTNVPHKMNMNRDWNQSYSSENQYEDADLKLGQRGEGVVAVERLSIVTGHRAVVDEDFKAEKRLMRKPTQSRHDVSDRSARVVHEVIEQPLVHSGIITSPNKYVKKTAVLSDQETASVLRIALDMAPYEVDLYNPRDAHMVLNDLYDVLQQAPVPAYPLEDVRSLIEAVMGSPPDVWAQKMERLLGRQAQANERQPWVAFDLDGTLLADPEDADYEAMEELVLQTGEEQQPVLKDPMPGATETLAELISMGWRVSIYTARFSDDLDPETTARFRDEIERHLDLHGIPFSDIWVGMKPRADYYVDNKAIEFTGDFNDVLMKITSLDPNGEQGPEEAVTLVDEESEEMEHEGVAIIDTVDDEQENEWLDPDETRHDRSIPRPPSKETMVYGS